MTVQILHGDCRELMAAMPAASVDAIVTDPPYEIGFMGKGWDNAGVAYDRTLWAEALRVLKPGGHLLAFGGTRTYHRMAVAIEDAGFEIRDSIHWLYGSGFPKSLDVSKAIDKAGGVSPVEQAHVLTAARKRVGLSRRQVADAVGCTEASVRDWEEGRSRAKGAPVEHITPSPEYRDLLADLLGYTADERRIVGAAVARAGDGTTYGLGHVGTLTAGGNTDAARQWEGWGTALKPAHEPIVVARKPLVGTVAANVLQHGTGALNIDSARVQYESESDKQKLAEGVEAIRKRGGVMQNSWKNSSDLSGANPASDIGRWPANLVLTHAADCGEACAEGCPVAELDGQSGDRPGGNFPTQRGAGVATGFGKGRPTEGGARQMGDSGGASRFFTVTELDPIADSVPFRYVAKPGKKERNAGLDNLPEVETRGNYGDGLQDNRPHTPDGYTYKATTRNTHPTVKPVALMRWLVRLVTPPNGTVLDPFTGSGTTGVAAILEGFDFIGCEMTDDYLPIIEGRLAWAQQQTEPDPESLFGQ